MSQPSYQQIHAYMLSKTREYYAHPPRVLVDRVLSDARSRGETLTRSQAEKQVSLIEIQRYVKAEMQALWPEFMSSIPENSLR